MSKRFLTKEIKDLLNEGTVIPAHPLAIKEDRSLDEAYQRLLTRYYISTGAGGVAVGVHSTQFEIRDPEFDYYERVLRLAAEEIEKKKLTRPFIKVAGICGPTNQALKEAEIAAKHGYDLGLLSMGGLNDWSEDQLIERVKAVAAILPVFGFYLQPAVGGRILSYDFWLKFSEIENVQAIKVAAFNRYQTLDVMRAVCNSSRCDEIAMYTGNDDNIIADLLTTYRFPVGDRVVEKEFKGGLLGHWAVWTKNVVELFDDIQAARNYQTGNISSLLNKGIAITDVNAVLFDVANNFKGCIPGIHEVLRRQGLLKGTWCLNPMEVLSKGQFEEISRVYAMYPDLNDDDYVLEFLKKDEMNEDEYQLGI